MLGWLIIIIMQFENSLSFLFTQITNSFKVALDKSLKQIGLHGGQIFILVSLWEEDGQSQIGLAQKLNLSPPTINKMVAGLSGTDFVKCEKCGKDGRVIRVFLTGKGLNVRAAVESQWLEFESKVFAPLTETEKLIFVQILEKLKENLLPKV